MSWIYLIIASVSEIIFTTSLVKIKEAEGILYAMWMGIFLTSIISGMVFLSKATDGIPMGTAYSVWTGIGAVGTALIGIFLFNEPTHFWRIFFMTTLIISVIGLKFVS